MTGIPRARSAAARRPAPDLFRAACRAPRFQHGQIGLFPFDEGQCPPDAFCEKGGAVFAGFCDDPPFSDLRRGTGWRHDETLRADGEDFFPFEEAEDGAVFIVPAVILAAAAQKARGDDDFHSAPHDRYSMTSSGFLRGRGLRPVRAE